MVGFTISDRISFGVLLRSSLVLGIAWLFCDVSQELDVSGLLENLSSALCAFAFLDSELLDVLQEVSVGGLAIAFEHDDLPDFRKIEDR